MSFVRINNRSNFVIKTIEVHHPETRAYVDYWRLQKKRCIEGFWSPDDSSVSVDPNKPVDSSIKSNQWRYMPEKLYFYVNFGTILHKPEDSPKTAPKQKMRPFLRDVEWEFFYNITEARGFSGFEEDNAYTCNHSVLLQEENLHYSCINPHTNKPKIYITPREYLRKLHSKPLGRALWENQAKNLFVLGSRGFGKDLEENTPIYSVSKGKIPIKDVTVGEYVYGADGKPTQVIDRFDFNNQLQYKIKLKSVGTPILSGEGHIWQIKSIAGILNVELKTFKDFPEHVMLPYKDSIDGEIKWSYVEYITPTVIKPSVCIAVDNKDKLFLAGEYVVTHNSFILGVGLTLHELLFDGARYYTQDSIESPFKVEVLVGAAMASKSSDLLAKTLDAYNNLPGSYGTDAEYIPSPFYKQLTGTLGPNNNKNPWRHEYEKKIGGQWIKQGTGSNLKHVIFTIENPEAAAGTRPGIIVVEETGLLPNLLTVHGSNTATQMEGAIKFGSSFYIGTGGNMEKIVESQVIFYDPDGFDFLAFDNEYEEDNRKIGWFVPAYYALNQYKDHNGNTNIEAAKNYLLSVREKKKKSKDTSALDLEMLNYPIMPSEMFLSKTGNIFPTALLRDRQIQIETDSKYDNALYIGKLKINSDTSKVEWHLDTTLRPIKTFPLTKESELNKSGAIVIYNHPNEDEYGDVIYNRYIAGLDPYDHDDSGTQSLGAMLVYDRFTNQIVAEYTGRPQTAKEYYENCRLLAKYYNAKILYENERKGIFDYFESKQSVYLLQEQPEIIKDVLQTSRVNRQYGMHMNSALKRYGEELIKTWLLSPSEDNSEILNAHTLRCLPLIQELIAYNPSGNYDRSMAFMMVMYFIQETRKIEIHNSQSDRPPSHAQAHFFNKPLFKKSKSYR
jgi:hypothetical protein